MKIGGNRGGGGKDFPKADPGKHTAVLAHIYDVGVHDMSYPGNDPSKSQRLMLIWELEAQTPDGSPFVVVDEVSVSLYKSSKMREAASAILDRPVGEDEELDSEELIGGCVLLTVIHNKKGNPKIDLRAAIQDRTKAKSLTVQGSYGPADPINRLVGWKMREADEGTVPPGQGVLAAPGKKKTEDSAPVTQEPAPQPDVKLDEDGIPF